MATRRRATGPIFDSSQAVTFSAGIALPEVGLGLSARTGWDTDGKIKYCMGSAGHDIGGGSDVPGGVPEVLDVGLP